MPLQAALALTALTAVFLWSALASGGFYAAADLLQWSAVFRIAPPDYVPKNPVQSDTVFQMFPFFKWSREQLWAGHLPLWNPYNGAGAPLLANYISAVFSPFSLPYYLLGFREAIVVAAFLKLLLLGCFTYLFLRRIAVEHGAAIVGAVAFTFSGYNVLWLNWPQTGTGVALPAALYCAECAVHARQHRERQRYLALAGFTLALTAGLLSGHPETFFYSALLLGAYILFRLALVRDWRFAGQLIVAFAVAGLGALGLSAVQLLPFLEYLRDSTIVAARANEPPLLALPAVLAALQAYPNLLGNPSLPYNDRFLNSLTNFNEVVSPYVGLITLFLAGLAVIVLPRSRSPFAAFFAAVSVLWLAYGYDVGGFGGLVQKLPVLSYGVIARSHIIWTFSVSCLAALAVHFLLSREQDVPDSVSPRRARPEAVLVSSATLWAMALLAGSGVGVYAVLQRAAGEVGNGVGTAAARAVVLPHLTLMTLSYVAAVLIVIVAMLMRGQRSARWHGLWIAGGLTLLVFTQTGAFFRDYYPTIESRYFYPESPTLAGLLQRTGGAQTLYADGALMWPNTNLWYGVRSPANYDAMGIRSYDLLYERLLRSATHLGGANPASVRSLQALGVQYVATARPYPFSEHVYGQDAAEMSRVKATDAVLPNQPIVFRFSVAYPHLTAITIPFAAFKRANTCTLSIALDDLTTGGELQRTAVACAEIRDDIPYIFTFPTQPNSRGRRYQLSLSSPDATPANAVAAYYVPETSGGEELRRGAQALGGRLVVDGFASPVANLERIWGNGAVNLFRVPGSLPRYFTAARGLPVVGNDEALRLLEDITFDIRDTVLLHSSAADSGQDDQPATADAAVQVIEEAPTRIRLKTERATPGWLVILQAHYPGWVARVNGHPVEMARANVAFSAVPIGAGSSDVVLEYDPLSVRYGLWASALTLGSLAGALFVLLRRQQSGDDPMSWTGPR